MCNSQIQESPNSVRFPGFQDQCCSPGLVDNSILVIKTPQVNMIPPTGKPTAGVNCVDRSYNLLTMPGQLIQAEHKCPLMRGAQRMCGEFGLILARGCYVAAKISRAEYWCQQYRQYIWSLPCNGSLVGGA